MRCVIDTSIVVKWFVEEGDSAAALALPVHYRLLAPELLIPEFANVLATKQRLGDLDEERVRISALALSQSAIDLRVMTPLMPEALRLAAALHHPAYDCFYLALALSEGCPLVTADKRFIKAVEQRGSEAQQSRLLPLAKAVPAR